MGSKSSTPPAVDPVAQADANVQAQIKNLGPAAQAYWNVRTNPVYGDKATTQLEENIRRELFPNETQVRDVLTQNVLQSLQSPTGITPEQQAALTARRGEAQNELIKAIRERANLGGKLYGGYAFDRETTGVSDLQNAFAESDINREQTNRLNAINSALPLLQLLYPNVAFQGTQFINPVVSADNQYSGAIAQRGQDMTYQAQQEANNSALFNSLFSGLGTAAGGLMGGPFGAALGSQLFKSGAGTPTQSQILGFNTAQYRSSQ